MIRSAQSLIKALNEIKERCLGDFFGEPYDVTIRVWNISDKKWMLVESVSFVPGPGDTLELRVVDT